MYFCVIVLLILFAFAIATPDYFWRPFDGTVPKDALISDCTSDKTVCIGNAPVWGGGLYIGELYEGKKQIIVTGRPPHDDSPVWIKQDDIQILCTRSPEQFEWVLTNSTTVTTILHPLIQGGYQYDTFWPTYVARVKYNNRYVIGKLTSSFDQKDYRNMLFIYDEITGGETYFTTYEVLIYKGSKNSGVTKSQLTFPQKIFMAPLVYVICTFIIKYY